jgi:hypothetical protein
MAPRKFGVGPETARLLARLDKIMHPPQMQWLIEITKPHQQLAERLASFGFRMAEPATEALPPTTAKRRRGRPKGSGSLAASDAELLERMHQLIRTHPGVSAWHAAGIVAADAAGAGTVASKRMRLVRRYLAERKSQGTKVIGR